MDSWNNTKLQKCLCWDSEMNDWCSTDQCDSYFKNASQGYVAGAAAVILLLLALFIWVAVSIVRMCCCKRRGSGGTTPKTVSVYKGVSIVLFVVYLAATCATAVQNGTDGYDGVTAVADVVNRKAQDDKTTVKSAQNSLNAIGSLPGGYVPTDVWIKFTDIMLNVESYSGKIEDARDGISNNYQWISTVIIWSPTISIVTGLIFIMVSLRCCAIHFNTWVLAILAIIVGCIQVIVGIFAFTSRDICRDYNGVANQVITIWNSDFGGQYGNKQGIIELGDKIKETFASEFCSSADGWAGYFSSNHSCSSFSDVTPILNNASAINQEWKADAGTCEGQCTIKDCATSCVQGSGVQLKAQAWIHATSTIKTKTRDMQNGLVPLVNGHSFIEAFAQLQSPLCDSFKPATRKVNTSLSVVVFATVFFIIALFFVAIIYVKNNRDTYEFIQITTVNGDTSHADYKSVATEETAVIEYPTKPIAYGSDAPVLH